MSKEFKDALSCPRPSQELLVYLTDTLHGQNNDIPTYGIGNRLIADFYGIDTEGNELARFRIPWGQNKKLERSYHVTRTTNGQFQVIDEGFYPLAK